jgi:hypothetical protein
MNTTTGTGTGTDVGCDVGYDAELDVALDRHQLRQLHRLLGAVEDWLLHCYEPTREDLGEFLAQVAATTASPEQLTAELILQLGDHVLELRSALTTRSSTTTRPATSPTTRTGGSA